MMKHILLIIFSCVFAQPAWAGWVVTYKDAETSERSQELYDDGKASFGELIVNGKNYFVVDRGAKAYWKGTAQQYCDALKAQMQMMQSMMPAQYRQKPISQRKVTRKKLGAKSIAGFSATGWEFQVDGSPEGKIWVSSDSGLSDIIEYERSYAKQMKCFDEMNRMGLEGAKLYKETVAGAFVLKESQRQVVSVERKSISSSQFSAPSGYKGFSDYNKFMDYVGSHSNASSGGSSRASAPPSFDDVSEHRSRKSAERDTEPEEQHANPADMEKLKENVGNMFKSLF